MEKIRLNKNGFSLHNILSLKNNKHFMDVFWMCFGRFGSAGSYFLLSLILMSILSVSDYGEFVVQYALFTFVPFFIDFGINNSFVSLGANCYRSDSPKYNSLKFTYLITKIGLFGMVILVLWIIDILDTSNHLPVYLLGLGSFIGLFEAIISILNAEQKFKIIAIVMPVRNFVAICYVVIYYFTHSIVDLKTIILLVGVAPVTTLILVLGIVVRTIKNFKKFNKTSFSELFNLSKWTVLFTFSDMLYINTNTFILKYFTVQKIISNQEMGYYSATINMAGFIPTITSVVSFVLLPKVSEIVDRSEINKHINSINKLIIPSLLISITGLLIIEFFIIPLFGDKFETSATYFFTIIPAMIITFFKNIYSVFFYPLKRVNMMCYTSLSILVLCVISDLILIPLFGGMGAAYTYLLVAIISLIITKLCIKKEIQKLQ